MPANARDVICRYHYDPLDRLVGTTPTDDDGLQRFYCKSRLATETQGAAQRSIFQQGKQLLAQQKQQDDLIETSLLATDQMRSVLLILKVNRPCPISNSPYGHRPKENGLLSLLGFNGERSDPITGHYLLGNGYRAFNPVLMRFNSPDSLSPFGKGGLNPYVYCLGDPINREDSSGHVSWLRGLNASLDFINKRVKGFFRTADSTTSSKNTNFSDFGNFYSEVEAPNILKNKMPFFIKIESRQFVDFQKAVNKSLIKELATGEDLKSLVHDYYYKFVFTDKQQLVVGGSPGTTAGHFLSHPVLSLYSNSPRITSAGYITRVGDNSYEIDNITGHYRGGFETLPQVAEKIRGFGADVESIGFI